MAHLAFGARPDILLPAVLTEQQGPRCPILFLACEPFFGLHGFKTDVIRERSRGLLRRRVSVSGLYSTLLYFALLIWGRQAAPKSDPTDTSLLHAIWKANAV